MSTSSSPWTIALSEKNGLQVWRHSSETTLVSESWRFLENNESVMPTFTSYSIFLTFKNVQLHVGGDILGAVLSCWCHVLSSSGLLRVYKKKKNFMSSKPVNTCSLGDIVHSLHVSTLRIHMLKPKGAALLMCEQRECTVYFPEAVQVNLTSGYRPVS